MLAKPKHLITEALSKYFCLVFLLD